MLIKLSMRIGIDDTDSPEGMCTTYLASVLIKRLEKQGFPVREARLVRLNPNVREKTRGNAAIAILVEGNPNVAFELTCRTVEELGMLNAPNTHPGIVVTEEQLPVEFYRKALTSFCTIEEAVKILDSNKAIFKGYKLGRGLIGATAAVAAENDDWTFELLTYRLAGSFGTIRSVDKNSLFSAELLTFPHTWDSVDSENDVVVCVPHTPDPVLFGIRGESPEWIQLARSAVKSEPVGIEQMFVTNQGTDGHILIYKDGGLIEGHSYRFNGTVSGMPQTGTGGHVSVRIESDHLSIVCMAYEPTKKFRDVIRALIPGDSIVVFGSYKNGSLNLEKVYVAQLAENLKIRPPVCQKCSKRMKSAGIKKGYKCRTCHEKTMDSEKTITPRELTPGWYEVPSIARRHLAKPLARFQEGTAIGVLKKE